MSPEFSVNKEVAKQREQDLFRLKERVNYAYNHRTFETYVPEVYSTVEWMRASEGKPNTKWTLKGRVINFPIRPDEPNVVTVNHSHDYLGLMSLAVSKLVETGDFPAEEAKEAIEESLAHEYEHSVITLGHKGFNLRYGVWFYETVNYQSVGIRPFIRIEGQMPFSLYKKIIMHPRQRSVTDYI